MSSRWIDCIDAAHRKIAISEFYCDQLRIVLGQYDGPFDGSPSIPIQAYFEGTVVATIAAIDQVAQVVNKALSLGLNPSNLFDGASPEIESRVSAFRDWKAQPIGIDLRRLRVRMVHYSYDKASNGGTKWLVETANEHYAGARDLSAYADAAVAYGREIGVIADELRRSLAPKAPEDE